jgi:hypothetical protein
MIMVVVLCILLSALIVWLVVLTHRSSSTQSRLLTVEGDMNAGNDIRIGGQK